MTQRKTGAETSLFDIIIYAMMIVAVIYVIVQSILGNNGSLHFKLTLGIWILAAVAVTDFVAPMVQKKFDGLDSKTMVLYGLYAVADGAMFGFFYIFIINVGFAKEPLHYVSLGGSILLFAVKTFAYRTFEKSRKEHINSAGGQADDWESAVPDGGADDSHIEIEELQVLRYKDKK